MFKVDLGIVVLEQENDQMFGLISDLTGKKSRKIREIKFFRSKKDKLGVAFFDNETVYGEYWIGNVMFPEDKQELILKSGYDLGVKYDATLFGINPIVASKKSLANSLIHNPILNCIYDTINSKN